MKKKIFYSLLICAASSVYAQTGNEISGKYTKLVFKTNLTEPDYPTKVNGILKTDISATVKNNITRPTGSKMPTKRTVIYI